jgi:lipopolysaccharide transport system ATP-binding protein
MIRQKVRRLLERRPTLAEVERFLEMPVKYYSSGMYMRLAFAVAAHFEPEVLILDEVLAVGDVAFQQKCLEKMKQVSREGRTIFFVSHDLQSMRQFCARALLIEAGNCWMMDR